MRIAYLFLDLLARHLCLGDLCERHCQMGSLAGAAHLLNNNTGALNETQRRQKRLVASKVKCLIDFDFQYEYKL